ncbi:hypothetical protein OO013_13640 [Mangrovivirga sp. M17]|uniref:Tetratricopeptide repeat protein n=1 Tax=Mangrovivirga halotolerans TaxID=2993936 RepID=A0ABT3RT15_9BACT|nr:hypothetical protein [Mangrovivirga halotolerans]MCX2744920.1 hypothetical protein [Mangrovivirga halotolerans]
MVNRLIISTLVLCLLSLPIAAQDYVDQFNNALKENKKVASLIDQLENRSSFKNFEKKSLEKVFFKIHRKVLKEYKKYSEITSTLSNGEYDCVTGTALYAYVYQSLGLKTEIFETPSHVFLVIEANGKKYLIESTSPLNGFLEIDKDIKLNTTNSLGILVADETDALTNEVINKITIKELAAISLHNKAAKLYLERDYVSAVRTINEALSIYPSARSVYLKKLISRHI